MDLSSQLFSVFSDYRGSERKEYGNNITAHYYKYYLWVNQINPPYTFELESSKLNSQILKTVNCADTKPISNYKFYEYKKLKSNIAYINYKRCRERNKNPCGAWLE